MIRKMSSYLLIVSYWGQQSNTVRQQKLKNNGVQKGDRVLYLYGYGNLELVVAVLACARIGALIHL